jgi:hypothetical protein
LLKVNILKSRLTQTAFGGPNSSKGNTGPFWVASGTWPFNTKYEVSHRYVGLAILSALITAFFIKPLDHDGMELEDRLVWHCSFGSILADDISVSSANTWMKMDTIHHRWVLIRRRRRQLNLRSCPTMWKCEGGAKEARRRRMTCSQ